MMATQPRSYHIAAGAGGHHAPEDTTFTKIFVGGLAWETQRETMRLYFEQFGEIIEAVVITDKHTGRSKGYGFVTFKDPEAAARACLDPSPVIDGRRANCNLASLGATHRPRPPALQIGTSRFWPPMAAFRGPSASTAYVHQPAHYALHYPLYGYNGGYSQENVYPMSYYGLAAGGQQHQLSPYYPTTSPGVFSSFYPYYTHYSHSSHAQGGFGLHYPQMIQYPYLPPQLGSSSAILSFPTTVSATASVGSMTASSSSKPPGSIQEQRPTA
ncbi:RNA-binding protein 24-like [Phalaenopsis equestris]|uniref:RNA-binding protein 24-like n=1 Tax=Phalaenopsis equestris TaxID=78828 RepID=UPI0009E2C2D0|nr:RNA-binding protein 24-like [Phalaenopsis equestris]